jgi:hypothetical protein
LAARAEAAPELKPRQPTEIRVDETTALNPQVPGQAPGVEPESLEPLLTLELADLVAGLTALTNSEIDTLVQLEGAGEARANYLDALTTEQMRRLEDTDPAAPIAPLVDENAPAPLGDTTNYAHMAGSDIDPTTLKRAVLSRDGWVLPSPAAQPE